MIIRNCDGGPNQGWRIDRAYQNRGNAVDLVGKCMDLNQNVDADGMAIQLHACNGSPAETLELDAIGSIHVGVPTRLRPTAGGRRVR